MLERINGFLWGVPVLGLILGTGLLLAIRTGFAQVRLFPAASRSFWRQLKDRDSGFRALCTALAATVGTGNIAGVAGAIAIGGPGAVFWMWVSAFLGMGVKYAEGLLAVRYRQPDGRAGPMYIIRSGLGDKWRWMAAAYALFGLLADALAVHRPAVGDIGGGILHLKVDGLTHLGIGIGKGDAEALSRRSRRHDARQCAEEQDAGDQSRAQLFDHVIHRNASVRNIVLEILSSLRLY